MSIVVFAKAVFKALPSLSVFRFESQHPQQQEKKDNIKSHAKPGEGGAEEMTQAQAQGSCQQGLPL